MAGWIQDAIDMGLELDVEEIKLLEGELGNPEVANVEEDHG